MTEHASKAAAAARSFRLATRLRDADRLAHELALHNHFDRFWPTPPTYRACTRWAR